MVFDGRNDALFAPVNVLWKLRYWLELEVAVFLAAESVDL